MKKKCNLAVSLLIVASLFIQLTLSIRTPAQTTGDGSVAGEVRDFQGAAVPGATVTLTGESGGITAVTDSAVTDSQGRFFFPFLTPGIYSVKVELTGVFEPDERKNLAVRSGQRTELEFTLRFGDLEEVIEVVTGEAAAINNAVERALDDPEKKAVIFDIPQTDPSYNRAFDKYQINLERGLPIIRKTMTFYNASPSIVELNGKNLSADAVCFEVNNAKAYFMGFEISGFRFAYNFSGSTGGSIINYCQIVGNREDGVYVDGAPNIGIFNSRISGNGGNGITIFNAVMTWVQNNNIGIAPDGRRIQGNLREGIRVEDSSGGMIGGATPGQGNTLVGNSDGMSLINSRDFQIQGNYIGTNPLGDKLGNRGAGIGLAGNSSDNKIGGGVLEAINRIGYNGHGIIAFSGTLRNLFLFNQFFDNKGVPIDNNFPDGATPNDPGDGDTGANSLQNFPVVTSADASATSTIIRATLNSTPNTTFTVQYYIDGPGGKLPLGSRSVTTDGNGNANADVTFPTPLQGGRFITTLATNTNTGDTSEFSPGAPITGTGQPDLEVTKTAPATINCGDQITYTITARNIGTAASPSVGVIDKLPLCLPSSTGDQVQVTTSQGFTLPIISVNNSIAIVAGLVAPGAAVTITITIETTFLRDCEGSISNEVTVFADGDSNQANDKASAQTLVVTPCPKITRFVVNGKNVFVQGAGFKKGDIIEINGEQQKAKFVDENTLKVKKGKKSLFDCDSTNPGRMNVFTLRRPDAFGGAPVIDTQAFATCP